MGIGEDDGKHSHVQQVLAGQSGAPAGELPCCLLRWRQL